MGEYLSKKKTEWRVIHGRVTRKIWYSRTEEGTNGKRKGLPKDMYGEMAKTPDNRVANIQGMNKVADNRVINGGYHELFFIFSSEKL